jgi:O-succinylbenzoic acid--CoA ligase
MRWDGPDTELLINPRLPAGDLDRFRRLVERAGPLPGHIWLATSGSGGRLKPVALSREAVLASAAAVNAHLESSDRDVWLDPLPIFHAGGLGIHARAHLSGARVVTIERWSPSEFCASAVREGATLSALVPAQVFDLLRAGLRAPTSLRAVVVGGGALGSSLYDRARALEWPLLPSYGTTECASQAATADLDSLLWISLPPLRALPHLTLRTDPAGRIEMRGASLFTGYATEDGLVDPKTDGWWRSDDLGSVENGVVTVTGRAGGDDVVKVLGESVALTALDQTLEAVMLDLRVVGEAALFAVPDQRAGAALRLACAGLDAPSAERLRAEFNRRVAPYERVTGLVAVGRIPRTALGKVVRRELREGGKA